MTTPGIYWSSPENLLWVEASIHLASVFARNGGKRMVVAGSCAEYDWNQSHFSEFHSKFQPATLYGQSKRNLYNQLETLRISFAWGYLFHLLGPFEQPSRFVPTIIRGLLTQTEIPCSHGNQIRDFLDVRDAADALVQLLDSDVQKGVNIGSGKGIALKSLAHKISSRISNGHLIKFGVKPSAGDPLELVADTTRLNTELGWHPKITLDQAIEEAIHWWQKNL
jgi:nucleoside-diphosphate-sugar epimerase